MKHAMFFGSLLVFRDADFVLHAHDLATRQTRNLQLPFRSCFPETLAREWPIFEVFESEQDLNGDGDTDDRVVHVYDEDSGAARSTGLAGRGFSFTVAGGRPVLVSEFQSGGADLNGDGDAEDEILHVHDPDAVGPTNLGLAAWSVIGVGDRWLAFLVRESTQGDDLNGDGDMDDVVLHVYDHVAGETTNSELAAYDLSAFGNRVLFSVIEEWQGADINDDGNVEDGVFHVLDLEAGVTTNLRASHALGHADRLVYSVPESLSGDDCNGDGDITDDILEIHDFAADETIDTGLAARGLSFTDDLVVFEVLEELEGRDLNVMEPDSTLRLLRGDCNDDSRVDISDAIFSLGSLFLGQGDPNCDDACDSNDDGAVDISDAIATLGVLFLGNGVIPAPGMKECGVDPSDDALRCETHGLCR